MPRIRETYPLQVPWLIVFTILIVHNLMPIVGRAISDYLTTYFLLAIVFLIYAYFISWKLNTWSSRLGPIMLIAAINLAQSFNNDPLIVTYSALLGFAPVIMGFRVLSMPYRQRKFLFIVAAIAFLITVCTSINGLLMHPTAARHMALIMSSQDKWARTFDWLNIGGFNFIYLTVVMYPIIICYMKVKKVSIVFYAAIVVLFFYLFLKAQYMTALSTFIILSSLWFLPKNLTPGKLFLVFAFMVTLMVLGNMFIGDMLKDFAADSDSEILAERMQYMGDSVQGVKNTSEVGSRERVLRTSWDGFMSSPLLGNWNTGRHPGGHSFTLDFMFMYGILGLGFLLWMYKRIYDVFYLPYRDTPYFGYAMASFFTAIFLSTVNTGSHWFELTLLVPLTLTVIPRIKEVIRR